MDNNYDDIRAYYDSEINDALHRIADDPRFIGIANRFFPEVPLEELKAKLTSFHDADSMQKAIMAPIIQKIVDTSATSFNFCGMEKLDKDTPYLFISNHRDVILDAALLQLVLFKSGFRTSEITFGNNLMINPFVVDIGRSNKMFKVERGGTRKEIYRNSMHLSEYIRMGITQRKSSIWIAQRNGRTKDGFDKTETGVLRMFGMSGSKNFVENYGELNIVPFTISFEYEPCDYFKTQEVYLRELHDGYTKAPDEDYQSILVGVNSNKGGINICINDPVTIEDLQNIVDIGTRAPINELTALINKRINQSYKLWKTNYIAYDMLHNCNTYADKYTPEEKTAFGRFALSQLAKIEEGDRKRLQEIFLGIYANPVTNRE